MSAKPVVEPIFNFRQTFAVATTPAASDQNGTANANFTLSVDGLDKEKIYKVVIGSARSAFYEVGFQMPLSPVTGIDEISTDPKNDSEAWFTLKGQRLQGTPTQQGLYVHNGRVILVAKP